MYTIIDSPAIQNVVTEATKEVSMFYTVTTMYNLITALHDILDPCEDELVIAIVVYLLRARGDVEIVASTGAVSENGYA